MDGKGNGLFSSKPWVMDDIVTSTVPIIAG